MLNNIKYYVGIIPPSRRPSCDWNDAYKSPSLKLYGYMRGRVRSEVHISKQTFHFLTEAQFKETSTSTGKTFEQEATLLPQHHSDAAGYRYFQSETLKDDIAVTNIYPPKASKTLELVSFYKNTTVEAIARDYFSQQPAFEEAHVVYYVSKAHGHEIDSAFLISTNDLEKLKTQCNNKTEPSEFTQIPGTDTYKLLRGSDDSDPKIDELEITPLSSLKIENNTNESMDAKSFKENAKTWFSKNLYLFTWFLKPLGILIDLLRLCCDRIGVLLGDEHKKIHRFLVKPVFRLLQAPFFIAGVTGVVVSALLTLVTILPTLPWAQKLNNFWDRQNFIPTSTHHNKDSYLLAPSSSPIPRITGQFVSKTTWLCTVLINRLKGLTTFKDDGNRPTIEDTYNKEKKAQIKFKREVKRELLFFVTSPLIAALQLIRVALAIPLTVIGFIIALAVRPFMSTQDKAKGDAANVTQPDAGNSVHEHDASYSQKNTPTLVNMMHDAAHLSDNDTAPTQTKKCCRRRTPKAGNF